MLDGLDLDVPAGSLTAILGPSGSGKTTLLRVLAGFERADAGTVRIGSADGRRAGHLPAAGAPPDRLRAAGGQPVPAPHRGGQHRLRARRKERHRPGRAGQRAAELLDAVGLAGLARRYPHQLSGGQQQRVALARALAIQPEVVLLDEPFASLDAHLRASVRADVQRLLTEAGATTVLVTHDQDEALSTADRVAVLRDGRIAQCAAPQELYSSPVDADMARFIGDANLIPGLLNGSSVETLFGRLPVSQPDPAVLTHCPATVLVRPEQVELAADGARGRWRGGPGHRLRLPRPRRGDHGARAARPGPGGPAADRAHPGRQRAAARRAGRAARPRARPGLARPDPAG